MKTMKTAQLYATSDRTVGAYLGGERGFGIVQDGEYVRSDELGDDRVLIDPASGGGRFSVMMTFYPS